MLLTALSRRLHLIHRLSAGNHICDIFSSSSKSEEKGMRVVQETRAALARSPIFVESCAATVDCILAAVSRQQAEEGGVNLNKGRRRVGRT